MILEVGGKQDIPYKQKQTRIGSKFKSQLSLYIYFFREQANREMFYGSHVNLLQVEQLQVAVLKLITPDKKLNIYITHKNKYSANFSAIFKPRQFKYWLMSAIVRQVFMCFGEKHCSFLLTDQFHSSIASRFNVSRL